MDNRRQIPLFLMIFMFSLFMLWDAWNRQNQAPQLPQAPVSAVPTPNANGKPGDAAVPTASPTAPAVEVAANVASTAPKATVKTDLFIAEISAQGGDLVHVELPKHRATGDVTKNFVLLDQGKEHVYLARSGFSDEALPNHKTVFKLASTDYVLKDGEKSLEVRLSATGSNGVKVDKVYTFTRGSYVINVSYDVTNTTAAPIAPHAYFQIVRDGKEPESNAGSAMMVGASTFTGPAVYTEEGKYQKVSFEDVTKGKTKYNGKADNGWIGLVQHYFVSAWLPEGKGDREFQIRKIGDNLFSASVILPVASIAPGTTGKLTVPFYAGPQEQDKLAKIATGFDLVVDYGWLTVIAAPMFWFMQLLHGFIGNWGWTIIALTAVLKLLFFPLSAASYKSMAKMKTVTPLMMKLKETYKDDRAKLNQEMMELYKREKINPLGGCLPVLVQIPVFIALYWVLLGTVEMRNAPWLGWITDLSAPDTLFGVIPFLHMPLGPLPLVMGATMFFQMRLNPTPPDPIQAKVMTFMPIVFTGMFLSFPAGLVLYWTVNNILSIAQQWSITRAMENKGK